MANSGIQFLESLPFWDGKTPFSLERIARVLERLGNPQNSLRSIHVAGTNGKGTVCTQLAAMLIAEGSQVGQYCSPHLTAVNERCLINGHPVESELLGEKIDLVADVARSEQLTLSYFEYITAASFLVFKARAVDWIVVEVGLGGRLDATNTLCKPEASVITSIGYDHQGFLGATLLEIAREKAGIIKHNVPVFVGEVLPEVKSLFVEQAEQMGSPIIFCDEQQLKVKIPNSLHGYQRKNAALSVSVASYLGISEFAIGKGLVTAFWPGRLELSSMTKKIGDREIAISCLLDAAHNQDGVRELLKFVSDNIAKANGIKKLIFVIAVSRDKNWQEMVAQFSAFASGFSNSVRIEFVITRFASTRSLEPVVLADKLQHAVLTETSSEALDKALVLADENTLIVISGSIYLIGEVRKKIVKKPFATVTSLQSALLLVDHGSIRKEANDMLEEVGRATQRLRPEIIVEVAHMELAEPNIAQGFKRCVERGAREIIIHPYMLAPGRHATEDIPRMVAKVADDYPDVIFRVTEPLGVHENIAQVVLERAGL